MICRFNKGQEDKFHTKEIWKFFKIKNLAFSLYNSTGRGNITLEFVTYGLWEITSN